MRFQIDTTSNCLKDRAIIGVQRFTLSVNRTLLKILMYEQLGKKILDAELSAVIKMLLTDPLKIDIKILRKYLPSSHWEILRLLQADCLRALSIKKASNWFSISCIEVEDMHAMTTIDSRGVSLDQNLDIYKQGIWDQITTNLEKLSISPNLLNEEVRSKFIMYYGIVDAVILYLSEVCAPQKNSNIVGFFKNNIGVNLHFNYWFSRYWARQSELGNLVEDVKIVAAAREQGKTVTQYLQNDPRLLDESVDYYIDKILSISPRFTQKIPDNSKLLMNELRIRMRVLVYCHLRVLEELSTDQQSIMFKSELPYRVTLQEFNNVGISQGDVNSLLDWSKEQPETERILFQDSIKYGIGNVSLAHGILRYGADILKTLGQTLGEWFEKEYLTSYIKNEVDPRRYCVYSGFKANHEEANKYDVDFVIEDVKRQKLFFCQVKYRIKTTFPTFKSALLEFFYGGQIQKGIEQLKAIEGVLTDQRVRNKFMHIPLLKNATDDWIKDNTGFILVHNIENFDFMEYNSISLYEWNTLRNLMRGPIIMRSADGQEKPFITDSLYLLDVRHNANAVIEWISKNSEDKYHSPSYHWSIIKDARIQILARRYWRFLQKWKSLARKIYVSMPLV